MGSEQLEEAGVDRLGAAALEQRRLSHMLRERGAEIEALRAQRERFAVKERRALEREEELRRQLHGLEEKLTASTAERDRVAAELKQSQYETRRAERRVEKTDRDAAEARDRASREQEQAKERFTQAQAQISSLTAERDRVAAELAKATEAVARAEAKVEEAGRERESLRAVMKRAQYEMRRAERQAEKADQEVAEARDERDRVAAELKQAGYEARRAARRAEKTDQDAAEARDRARREQEQAEEQISSLSDERDRIATALKQAGYEARRAERRVGKVERTLGEVRKRNQLQLDSLAAELRVGLAGRDEALSERDEALEARDRARTAAADSVGAMEEHALELGRAQREVELLAVQEKEREVLLAGLEPTLEEVAKNLSRVRASRSWRWGHALAQALRALTFRRRSDRSALDSALELLGADESEVAQVERRAA